VIQFLVLLVCAPVVIPIVWIATLLAHVLAWVRECGYLTVAYFALFERKHHAACND